MVFGREVGESGTPHLQGAAIFTESRTLSWWKTQIPGGHFEMMRGPAHKAFSYCKKDQDFETFGEVPMSRSEASRHRWECALQSAKDGKIEEIDPELQVRYYATFHRIHQDSLSLKRKCPDISLKPWQQQIWTLLLNEPDDRTIIYVQDSTGGAGKTTFARYLSHTKANCRIYRPSRGVDLAYMYNPTTSIAIFDLPRSSGEAIPWSKIEEIKDGYLASTKYECRNKEFPPPHVLVFSNHPLPEDKISQDRIKLIVL